MSAKLQIKQQAVEELAEVVGKSQVVVAAHYRGMTVTQMTRLRAIGRERGVHIQIIKNTLARRALVGSQYEGLQDKLVGPTILAFSIDEPNAAAKLIQEFSKECEALKVQALGLENKVLAADALNSVAKMPNREQAIVMLLVALNGPVQKLACTMQETYAKLARVMQEVAKKRESQQ